MFKKIDWTYFYAIGLLLIIGISLISPIRSEAGQLGNYPQTAGLNYTDLFPLVRQINNTNLNVNWGEFIQLISSGLNWTDIKTVGTKYGDHSGINWQAFGA